MLIVGTATDGLKSFFSAVLMVGTAADELKVHGASPLPWSWPGWCRKSTASWAAFTATTWNDAKLPEF